MSEVVRLPDGSLRCSGAPVRLATPVSARVTTVDDGDLVVVRSAGRVLAKRVVAAGLGAPWAIWAFGASKINGRSIF